MAKKTKDKYLKNNLMHNLFMTIFIIVFAILWFCIISNMINNKTEFIKTAEKTTAIITNIDTSMIDDKINRVDIKYSVNNIEYTGILKETSTDMYKGMRIDIYYNLNNPSEFIQYSFMDDILLNGFGYFVVIVGIFQLIYFIKKLYIYLYTLNGREIETEIVGLINGIYFGQKYFRIQCQWKDERGISHTFYSEKFTEIGFDKVFEKMNITTLTVRIKENNPSKYVVLTDKIHKKLDR